LIIVPIITSIGVSSSYNVGIAEGFIPTVSSLFAAITTMTRLVLLVVFFVVTARAWLPHMIFSIRPTVGNFHEPGDSFRLLSAEFLDIRFSSDAIAEGVNCPVDGDIFGSVQKFSKTSNVCAN
jgi:hypothetical protein